jgi:beta-lactamase superfamily II metal-dependent hydrolase
LCTLSRSGRLSSSLTAAAVFLCLCCTPAADQQSAYVDVIFFDVGQGDGIAVRSPEGSVAVIDGAIVERLRAYGIESVDIAIASHADTDHISGLEDILRSMPVAYYMDNGYPSDIAAYANIALLLRNSNTVYLQPAAGEISLGSVTLTILPPPAWAQSDQNNASIGVIVGLGEFRALLTGDSEVPELNDYLDLDVPDVTVLKAAHHGSRWW